MKKLFTGRTARQELVDFTASYLRRNADCGPELAINAVLDGARPGTLGGAMLAYYLSMSDQQASRLFAEVRRQARR